MTVIVSHILSNKPGLVNTEVVFRHFNAGGVFTADKSGLDEGWGDRAELSVRVVLDDSGAPVIDYPDLRSSDQLQKRRILLAHVESVLASLRSSVPEQSKSYFFELARKAALALQLDDSMEAVRDYEFSVDDGVLVSGRLESRNRPIIDGLVDSVISESGLMRGGRERTIKWIVVLVPELDLFVAGRTYRAFLEGAIGRFRRRAPNVRAIAVTPDINQLKKTFGSLFQGYAYGFTCDKRLAGIDGIFIPDEFAYVVCSDVSTERSGTVVPKPRCLATTRFDAVREIVGNVFSSLSLAKVRLDGVSEKEWQELSDLLRKMTEAKEARILRLKRKKTDD